MSEFTPLREAVEALASRSPSPGFGELQRRATRRGRRRLVMVASAGAVAFIAVAGGLANGTLRGSDELSTTGAPPTGAATPTPTASTTGAPSIHPLPGDPRFEGIEGLAVASSGTVYVVDGSSTGRLLTVTPEGNVTTLVDLQVAGNQAAPRPIAVDASGTVYAASGAQILKISPDGHVSTLAGQPGRDTKSTPTRVDGTGTEARFGIILDATVAPDGSLYVADSGWIRKVTAQGKVDTLNTCRTTPAARADCLGWPARITVDAEGMIYTGSDDYAIRRITPQGQVTVLAQGDTSSTGHFHRMYGLAIDPTDASVLATDTLGLQKISPDGTVTTVIEDQRLGRIAFAPDGTLYAVRNQDEVVAVTFS